MKFGHHVPGAPPPAGASDFCGLGVIFPLLSVALADAGRYGRGLRHELHRRRARRASAHGAAIRKFSKSRYDRQLQSGARAVREVLLQVRVGSIDALDVALSLLVPFRGSRDAGTIIFFLKCMAEMGDMNGSSRHETMACLKSVPARFRNEDRDVDLSLKPPKNNVIGLCVRLPCFIRLESGQHHFQG